MMYLIGFWNLLNPSLKSGFKPIPVATMLKTLTLPRAQKGSHENIAKIASILNNKESPWKIICSDAQAFESSPSNAGMASLEGVDSDSPWIKLNPNIKQG